MPTEKEPALVFLSLRGKPYLVIKLSYNVPTNRSKRNIVHTVAIRDLKNNPSSMTKYLDEGSSVFVTRHGKPIGITLPLNEDIFSIGVKKTVAIELYKMEIISLGKMAELLEIPKQEAMSLLNSLDVAWIEDDVESIKSEANKWL